MAENEPGVIDEGQLVVKIGDSKAGGVDGQLILDDVTFGMSRDNEDKHGVGNYFPQGTSHGNITFSVSTTAMLNGESARLVKEDISVTTPLEGELRAPDPDSDGTLMKVAETKLEWNDISVEATDDGDALVSFDFNARGTTDGFPTSA